MPQEQPSYPRPPCQSESCRRELGAPPLLVAVAQSCLPFFDPTDPSMSGFPVLHCLPGAPPLEVCCQDASHLSEVVRWSCLEAPGPTRGLFKGSCTSSCPSLLRAPKCPWTTGGCYPFSRGELPMSNAELKNGGPGGSISIFLEVTVAAGCRSNKDCQLCTESHTWVTILHR